MTAGDQQATDHEDDNYNPVFERLVGPPDGELLVEGFIAYGLYKIAKREWVSEFRARERRKPTPAELEAYVATWTASQVQGAKERAAQALAEFASDIIEAEEPKTLRRALRGSFLRAFWPSLTASVVYTLILILLAFVLTWAGVDLLGIFQHVGNGGGGAS